MEKRCYMAAEALIYITYTAIILLLGVVCILISQKIKIPSVLLLILAGIALSKIKLIGFPEIFLTTIGILALVMIAFDSASRLKLKAFGSLSLNALKLTAVSLALNSIFLAIFTKFILKIDSMLLVFLFAVLMSNTDFDIATAILGRVKNRVFRLLEAESVINTPLIVLLPFIILDLVDYVKPGLTPGNIFTSSFLGSFLLGLITGIGAGILVGIVIFKVVRKAYSGILIPLVLITAALLAYILAENLGGNGVLAVMIMGLFFGNVYVKKETELMEFSAAFADFVEIFVFVLVGLTIGAALNFSLIFILKSLLLFFIYLAIRYISVHISLMNGGFSEKEKVFMALNMPKGIAVAVIVFSLTAFKIAEKTTLNNIAGLSEALSMVLLFMLYSIILSTICIKLSRHFLKIDAKRN